MPRSEDFDTVGSTVGELLRSDAFDTVGIVGRVCSSLGGGRNIGLESSSELELDSAPPVGSLVLGDGVSMRYSVGRLPASEAIGIGGTRSAAFETVGNVCRLTCLGGCTSSPSCGDRSRRCAGVTVGCSNIGTSVSPGGICLSGDLRPR